MWEVIRELVAEGVTVLLTTQYLDEADELANHIVVIDHGRVIAEGTPLELKEASRGARLEVTLAEPHSAAGRRLAPLVAGAVAGERGRTAPVRPAVDNSPGLATLVVRALDEAGVLVDNIEVRQPSLDDVFFSLTGDHIEEEAAAAGPGDESGDSGGSSSAAAAPSGPVGSGEGRHELEGVRA